MYTETSIISGVGDIPRMLPLGDCTYRAWQLNADVLPLPHRKGWSRYTDDYSSTEPIPAIVNASSGIHRKFYLFYFNDETRGKETKRRERENDNNMI